MIVNNVQGFWKGSKCTKIFVSVIANRKVCCYCYWNIHLNNAANKGRIWLQSPHQEKFTCILQKGLLYWTISICVLRCIAIELYARGTTLSHHLLYLKIIIIKSPWEKDILRKFMHGDFQCRRCENERKSLIERRDIVSWRFQFQKAMRKYNDSCKA